MDEIGAASLQLVDKTGRVVGATDRNLIGTNYRTAPFFVEAQRSNDTVFTTSRNEAGAFSSPIRGGSSRTARCSA